MHCTQEMYERVTIVCVCVQMKQDYSSTYNIFIVPLSSSLAENISIVSQKGSLLHYPSSNSTELQGILQQALVFIIAKGYSELKGPHGQTSEQGIHVDTNMLMTAHVLESVVDGRLILRSSYCASLYKQTKK